MSGSNKKIVKNETRAILDHWQAEGLDDRLAHLIKDATRALVRALQIRLIEYDVSFGHWTFLRILWEKDGMTQRALSEAAGVMEPTTYAALTGMEKLGYIERRQSPENKKNMYVFLTEQGRALESKLVPLAVEVNEISMRDTTEDEIRTTRKVLLAMIKNLAADESDAGDAERKMPSTQKLGNIVSRSAATK
ncbi:MAG: MarR family transcriptional regulator [Herbaspirillum sp.]|uniref:MarR family winged helix-turn-helix transcriptional regulator n=1 Tax=Herbaspirillum sp. TaxID=1890675 RepID=UPI00258B5ABC|nr:MarR family transcriptional regulator [Herbaspirillum sp.]MCP3656972.1 MarR family transcriptional regulator [Herbaspirillum sp.]MCP3949013.1 MarR family transcriptional regulator [Herbaspirillum sp.]MCP4030457.1 MarR family transcriptional regulator [Herbaspirillum sp.]MCP4557809.1 MarR family transcriptional regulator [Herbaspirillum sp.]